ncbi:MAG: hypothetical protein AAGK93_02970 [Pseudomonadota bacterium]
MPKDDTDREILRLTAAWRVAQDGADLNNEVAGRQTGRQTRFLPGDATGDRSTPAERRAKVYRDLLDLLLTSDPIYAARYAEAEALLDRAGAATEAAIAEAQSAAAEAAEALEDVLDRANRLPDGRRVFRAADGAVFDEHGQRLSDAEAAGIVWKDDAPSYEAYRRVREQADASQQTLNDLLLYQVDVIGHWRGRMDDRANPPSLEELDEMQRQIEEKAPAAVRRQMEPDAPETGGSGGPSQGIDIQKL